jgi:hypothetical protein
MLLISQALKVGACTRDRTGSKGLFGTALLHKSQLSFMNFTAEQLCFEVVEFLKVFG